MSRKEEVINAVQEEIAKLKIELEEKENEARQRNEQDPEGYSKMTLIWTKSTIWLLTPKRKVMA